MAGNKKTTICDVPGIRIGHFHQLQAKTGCTVIIPDQEAICGVDVRGSAPGTREIELLKPVRLVQKINAILLTGGSAFGLDAAGGVQQYLEERNLGFDTGVARVPIVPTAVIFDLAVGDPYTRPDKSFGYQACQNASYSTNEGQIGAACGATVGKLLGIANASPGGLGTASIILPDGLVVGALSVVNALGEIIDDQGRILAGIRRQGSHSFIPSLDILSSYSKPAQFTDSNTTLTVVATNASLTRESATKIAEMAQDGLALAIRPSHTLFDGDIVFTLSTGEFQTDISRVGALACRVVAESIRRSVQ
ncbi:MAG: peptidase S58 family protein [Calditrichaeota bacterium]|nr:MAG: peptidase S58 family protein [Calditrichota bacterium]